MRLWRDAVAAQRRMPAYLVEEQDGWREMSWPEAARAVEELANGLLARGIKKGDSFAILARTTPEWLLFDFALALAGAVSAPIYPNSAAGECAYIVDHSEAVGVLAEDDAQLAKLDRAAHERLEHVLSFADLDHLRADGRAFAAEHPRALKEASEAIDEEDLYTYIYTSGTTGRPKGCMIRHRNYYAMTSCIEQIEGLSLDRDVMLLYLPLAHNFGRLMGLWGAYAGFAIAFCPDPLRVREVLPQVRPTLLPSVPRVFEKVHASVVAQIEEARGVKRRLADWSLGVGREVSTLRQTQRPIPPSLALRHRLADRLLFRKVKNGLGGRLRIAISGGAPLAKEIAEFFHALDVLIIEGWGQTECTTAATVNRPNRYRFGTIGPPMPGQEVTVADDGELLIRGETVFAGYLKDDPATREVLGDDGWLRSGDLGEIDDDGFVRITGRKKDLLVTAGGKNVAPQNLENALKQSRYVSQAVIVGDRRPYVAALVTLDPESTAGMDDGAARDRVQEAVDEVNRDLSRFEQIKRFAILPRDFSAEEGEVTPTLKLKRRVIEQHFADEIERLYAG